MSIHNFENYVPFIMLVNARSRSELLGAARSCSEPLGAARSRSELLPITPWAVQPCASACTGRTMNASCCTNMARLVVGVPRLIGVLSCFDAKALCVRYNTYAERCFVDVDGFFNL
jgi:hypothetical protein